MFKGVILYRDDEITNTKSDEAMRLLNIKVDKEFGCYDWEDYEDVSHDRYLILDSRTKDYFYGSSDGMDFIAVDTEESLKILKEVYPEFTVEDMEHTRYPWDYDYKRDK